MTTVEALSEALHNEHVVAGGTAIVGSRVHLGEDSGGGSAMFVEVTLSNPPHGQETWPVEDIWQLRRTLRDVISHVYEVFPSDEKLPWFISFVPEDAGELDPEDTAEQL
jgi:hypothetical protein